MHDLLVIDWGLIGDVIASLPLFSEIRHCFPEVRIAVVTNPYAAPVFAENPAIDRVLVLHKKEYMRELVAPGQHPFTVYRNVIFSSCDVCLDLIGNNRSCLLTLMSGARTRIGVWKHKSWRNRFYSTCVDIHDPSPILSAKVNAFLNGLGIVPRGDTPRWFFSAAEAEEAAKRFQTLPAARARVGLFPSAGWHAKMWPLINFRTVVNRLKSDAVDFFLILGPREPDSFVKQCRSLFPDITVLRDLSLRQAAAVIDHVDLLVTNDTGPLHIARAAGTPVVALFGPTHPAVVELGHDSISLSGYHACPHLHRTESDIHPCLNTNCPDPVCIKHIKSDDVIAAVQTLLRHIRKTGL